MALICPYNTSMPRQAVKNPPKSPSILGKHLATLRKEAGLTQVEVARALGIPQRTVSFYEREASYLPSNLIEPLSELLGISAETLLGIEASGGKKRGPKSKLERQFERIQKLPRPKQEFIAKLLTQILSTESA